MGVGTCAEHIVGVEMSAKRPLGREPLAGSLSQNADYCWEFPRHASAAMFAAGSYPAPGPVALYNCQRYHVIARSLENQASRPQTTAVRQALFDQGPRILDQGGGERRSNRRSRETPLGRHGLAVSGTSAQWRTEIKPGNGPRSRSIARRAAKHWRAERGRESMTRTISSLPPGAAGIHSIWVGCYHSARTALHHPSRGGVSLSHIPLDPLLVTQPFPCTARSPLRADRWWSWPSWVKRSIETIEHVLFLCSKISTPGSISHVAAVIQGALACALLATRDPLPRRRRWFRSAPLPQPLSRCRAFHGPCEGHEAARAALPKHRRHR